MDLLSVFRRKVLTQLDKSLIQNLQTTDKQDTESDPTT